MKRVLWLAITVKIVLFSCISHAKTGVFPQSTFDNLDYGLYWFGADDSYEKAIPGHQNAYYNRYSPTVIFIHGWQPGSTEKLSRETWDLTDRGAPDVDLAYPWISRGYNIGILYWNQFADEKEVKDAEAKMWSIDGRKGMRWRDSSGDYHDGPRESVSNLLFNSVVDNMSDFQGDRLIIAGHSLGNQLAVILSKKLQTTVDTGLVNPNLKPTRVALLDPFYSKGKKKYLDKRWTGEVARDYVSSMKEAGIIFEAYRSSGASSTGFVGDKNKKLLNMTAFVELKPWYFGAFQFSEKHIAARWHYFWSLAYTQPGIKRSDDEGLSASAPDWRVRELMNGSKRLIQIDGRYTETPDDDRQKYARRL